MELTMFPVMLPLSPSNFGYKLLRITNQLLYRHTLGKSFQISNRKNNPDLFHFWERWLIIAIILPFSWMKALYICLESLDLMEKGWDRPSHLFKRRLLIQNLYQFYLLQPDMHGSKGIRIKIKGFKFWNCINPLTNLEIEKSEATLYKYSFEWLQKSLIKMRVSVNCRHPYQLVCKWGLVLLIELLLSSTQV